MFRARRRHFLDVLAKIPYLVALGINVLQPLPVDEVETDPSMGYDGADLFSPDFPYVVTDSGRLKVHLGTINGLLAAKGFGPISLSDIASGPAQLKALIDLCSCLRVSPSRSMWFITTPADSR